MAYQNNGTYQKSSYGKTAAGAPVAASANRPNPTRAAATGGGMAKGGDRKELPPTTHTMKAKQGDFVQGVFITENEFGLFVNIKAGVEPGHYYINKRKAQTTETAGE